ncbi:MAG: hypothetical protein H0X71_07225 [Rubrobacter sp.]|nr:hypothetical protein [Rubrobacter sp.]
MKKFAMIGYYPNSVSGGVYAVGNEGITLEDAKELAAEESLELFQLFPLKDKETRQHQFYRRQEDGSYKQGRSREFAARLSGYVGSLIEKDEAGE